MWNDVRGIVDGILLTIDTTITCLRKWYIIKIGGSGLGSFGIGAKLRQERVGKGLAIDDISRDTRIAPRFIEAIETDDYSILPGLVFTRNFVRQYALTLHLDPDPLLAELPRQDEATVPLPNPPARARSSYRRDRRVHAIRTSLAWLVVLAGVGIGIYFRHSLRALFPHVRAAASSQTGNPAAIAQNPAHVAPTASALSIAGAVQVSLTAHAASWVEVSTDGKTTFAGMLKPNETKEVWAAEQVKVVTGNAGGLTISLNGKTLESLGPSGQVREVRLTAEGPQFLSKDPLPAPDPL